MHQIIEPKKCEIDKDSYDKFDNYIDESYMPIHIGDCTYSPSQVLKEVDPTAYDTMYADWKDGDEEYYYECPLCALEYDDIDEARDCCQSKLIGENELEMEASHENSNDSQL